LTEHVKAAVSAELDRQRMGLDALHGVRAIAISVKLPPWPARASGPVVVEVQTEMPSSAKKT